VAEGNEAEEKKKDEVHEKAASDPEESLEKEEITAQ
jgi:hypothetical protein